MSGSGGYSQSSGYSPNQGWRAPGQTQSLGNGMNMRQMGPSIMQPWMGNQGMLKPAFDGSTQDLGNGMQMKQMGPSMLPPGLSAPSFSPMRTDPTGQRPPGHYGNAPMAVPDFNPMRTDPTGQRPPGHYPPLQMNNQAGPSMIPPGKAWTPPPPPGMPQQPPPQTPPPAANGLPARFNNGFQYDYNQAGGQLPKTNQPQPFRMPDGRMVDLRALNPEGLPMNIDANGIPRFTPTAMGQSGMDYAQSVGDGFTGARGGNNWVNGRVFLGEPLHQGDGGMDPAMRSFLNTYRSRIGGTAANYRG